MARIKVTGYIETDGLDPEYVDLTDDSGLSSVGYSEVHAELGLDDAEFELED